jgi:nitroreductase
MTVYDLIKSRKAIRAYTDKPINPNDLEKVISAGIWGPSLLAVGFQPWKFVVVENKEIIVHIGDELIKKIETIGIGGKKILRTSSLAVYSATALVVVYNDRSLSKFVGRFEPIYKKIAKYAEISAIAAAIQNMIIVAESTGIASCWLDAPLFCEKRINKVIDSSDKLVAILTLGYPKIKGRRSIRKPKNETVRRMK